MLLACGLLSTAAAQTLPPLTDAQVRGFIESVSPIEALGREYDYPIDLAVAYRRLQQRPQPMAAVVNGMRGRPAFDELHDVVLHHGFTGPARWAQVGDRVLQAHAALQLEPTQARIRAEMQQRLRAIDADPSLSAEQRATMKGILGQSLREMRITLPASAADMAAVRPHQAQLAALLQRP